MTIPFTMQTFAVFVAAVLVSAPAVFGGFSSLFCFKADGDSLLSVSALGATVQYVVLLDF